MKHLPQYIVKVATTDDYQYAEIISEELALSAAKRGVNINKRTPQYVQNKINNGQAVIAINSLNNEWVGFCCIEVWAHEKYLASSGLIISPKYRGLGISKSLKVKLFELCQMKFPSAKFFSLTSNPVIMHINHELGYTIVPYSDVMRDPLFANGGSSWVDYADLMSHPTGAAKHVAMVYDPFTPIQRKATSNISQYFFNKIKSIKRKVVRVA